MKISTLQWDTSRGWNKPPREIEGPIDLILYFGSGEALEPSSGPWRDLVTAHPEAVCAGCSTAGQIQGSSVSDAGLCATLVRFHNTRVRGAAARVDAMAESRAVGAELGRQLAGPDLRHVFVLSDGLGVNGTALTTGLRDTLPPEARATGGLAGDGTNFKRTVTGLGAELGSGRVVAVGFYGPGLEVGYGSAGGWEPFGPKRLITSSEGSVLTELDGQPALALYKRYLGDRAAGLPATGLLFPLELLPERDSAGGVVRTILAVDETAQSLTFAGDMPQGQYARLMKASCDALVGGATTAAERVSGTNGDRARLALLVSCVGRKLLLGQRVEEEVEAVVDRLPLGTSAIGFYSYGEICPSGWVQGCDLHNQTMTLTVLAEN